MIYNNEITNFGQQDGQVYPRILMNETKWNGKKERNHKTGYVSRLANAAAANSLQARVWQ